MAGNQTTSLWLPKDGKDDRKNIERQTTHTRRTGIDGRIDAMVTGKGLLTEVLNRKLVPHRQMDCSPGLSQRASPFSLVLFSVLELVHGKVPYCRTFNLHIFMHTFHIQKLCLQVSCQDLYGFDVTTIQSPPSRRKMVALWIWSDITLRVGSSNVVQLFQVVGQHDKLLISNWNKQ